MSDNNDLLLLGSSILFLGLLLTSYSVSTYIETKKLSEKIDFELIDDNNELTPQDKYYKYLSIADFLNQKLKKNQDIIIKNTSCIYLDFAQHNAIELYRLTNTKINYDIPKKNVAAGNVRNLYEMLDNYKTCKKSSEYKTELNNILTNIQKNEQFQDDSDIRTDRILTDYPNQQIEETASDNIIEQEQVQNSMPTQEFE